MLLDLQRLEIKLEPFHGHLVHGVPEVPAEGRQDLQQ